MGGCADASHARQLGSVARPNRPRRVPSPCATSTEWHGRCLSSRADRWARVLNDCAERALRASSVCARSSLTAIWAAVSSTSAWASVSRRARTSLPRLSCTARWTCGSGWRRRKRRWGARRKDRQADKIAGERVITQNSPRNYSGSCSQREPKRPKGGDARTLTSVVWSSGLWPCFGREPDPTSPNKAQRGAVRRRLK